jgi:hypothetical protein
VVEEITMETILAFLFGPELGSIRDWDGRVTDLEGYDEQGSIGIPQPKQYRDAIERVRAEGL